MIKKVMLLLSHILERPFHSADVIAGRYEVIKHLGAGGYGHSYLVFDEKTGTKKVLKALRLHKRLTKAGRNGFELEKKLLGSLEHPGFPKYYEDGMHNTIPFFTMEYINGKNFEQLIFYEGWKITELESFTIASKLLEQIDYLHRMGVIHRDIRIPNVLLDGTSIRLIDLGLARPLDGSKNKKGPSQDLRKELNFQADFYGLGHFLLFLLYSNFSFEKNQQEKSWEEELNISPQGQQIIKRLLQINPVYENCDQVRADIHLLTKQLGGMKHVIL
ncbi:serine/threonine-protein kinase [Bacillus sp. JJ1764]|uniref:serine/threonine-protein kinase n=1 Tax=Bacillus sp. JJ1764 TaxID=3122964 RepID=UPI002FFF0EFA